MYSKKKTSNTTEPYLDKCAKLKQLLQEAEVVVIGAGAGLSTSAGLNYGGERFQRLFPDFIQQYGLTDMYSSAFYPFPSKEAYWAYFSRHIYHNRYDSQLNSCYADLLQLVQDKNYFVLTTNADHLFVRNSFPKERLCYLQGNYGLFQCSVPCHQATYDNREQVMEMVAQQTNGSIPTELLPLCPRCGQPMEVNLRKDGTFVEDEGWHRAVDRYQQFLREEIDKRVLFLELGVGYNTPSIIKYPFWQMTHQSQTAHYVCVNQTDARYPKELGEKGLSFQMDIHTLVRDLLAM